MKIYKRFFGKTKDGEDVYLFTLENSGGMRVSISTFGGAVVSIFAPDREGRYSDVVCGYDSLSDYESADGYQGALVGRFGNRIGKGRFKLDGKEYRLYCNDGNNHLHGGKVGFSHKVWETGEPEERDDAAVLPLSYVSRDGEEGYPGTLKVEVEYSLDEKNAFGIKYKAVCDKKTVLNLTNHTYFNLGGYASGSVLNHIIEINADTYIETDGELIPTGNILSVEKTPFDFRKPKAIGQDFYADFEALKIAGGYDHCLNFTPDGRDIFEPVVSVYEPACGRIMKVYTDRPSVQFYTGNFLNDVNHPFKGGYPQNKQNAFCLETQAMPDSMNHEGFTDCTLSPGEVFESFTTYEFSAK